MTIQTFISKALDGGYRHPSYNLHQILEDDRIDSHLIGELVLIPDVWKAVGKVEGWEDHRCLGCNRVYPEYVNGCVYHETGERSVRPDPFNRYHQHRMIDHLCVGGTIESFIETL